MADRRGDLEIYGLQAQIAKAIGHATRLRIVDTIATLRDSDPEDAVSHQKALWRRVLLEMAAFPLMGRLRGFPEPSSDLPRIALLSD